MAVHNCLFLGWSSKGGHWNGQVFSPLPPHSANGNRPPVLAVLKKAIGSGRDLVDQLFQSGALQHLVSCCLGHLGGTRLGKPMVHRSCQSVMGSLWFSRHSWILALTRPSHHGQWSGRMAGSHGSWSPVPFRGPQIPHTCCRVRVSDFKSWHTSIIMP